MSTARLCAEIWAQIKSEDWSLVSSYYSDAAAGRALWDFTKPYQWLGHAGGGGIGYGAPASVGAALANRKHGRLSVAIQTDGDLMYAPGVLWTAAHHRIPLLSVMNNNRAYHMELCTCSACATRATAASIAAGSAASSRARTSTTRRWRSRPGRLRRRPDYRSQGSRPRPQRAIAVVKRGEPALVDVVTQVR